MWKTVKNASIYPTWDTRGRSMRFHIIWCISRWDKCQDFGKVALILMYVKSILQIESHNLDFYRHVATRNRFLSNPWGYFDEVRIDIVGKSPNFVLFFSGFSSIRKRGRVWWARAGGFWNTHWEWCSDTSCDAQIVWHAHAYGINLLER